MSINNCIDNSVPCQSVTPCGCSHKMSTLCVVYEGLALGNLNIVNGQNLETILGNLDTLVNTLTQSTELGWLGTNLGGNAAVYKGENLSGIHEFRTIKGGSNVTVTQNGTDIEIAATLVSSGEVNTASNVGGGVGVFKQKSGYDLQLRTVTGSGGINVTQVGDTVDIDGSGIGVGTGEINTASNVGVGEGVFKQKVGYDLQFKKIRPGSNVNFVVGANDIEINATTSGEMNVQTDWNETNPLADSYFKNRPNIPNRLLVDIGGWNVETQPYRDIVITSSFNSVAEAYGITNVAPLIFTDPSIGGIRERHHPIGIGAFVSIGEEEGGLWWVTLRVYRGSGEVVPATNRLINSLISRGTVLIEF